MEARSAIIIGYVEDCEHSPRLRRLAQTAVADGAILICADSGGAVAHTWGLRPDLLLGDMDSLDPQILTQLEASGVPVQKFPTAKDETDLELAIMAALERGCRQLRILGGIGGRLDQTLGNLFLLALSRFAETGAELSVTGEQEEIRLVRGEASLDIEGEAGNVVSLLPATAQVTGIRTTNLLYPLQAETLFFGSTRGISNIIVASPAQVSIQSGLLFVIHRFGQS